LTELNRTVSRTNSDTVWQVKIQITAVLQAVQKHITGVTHTVVTTHISNIHWKWIRAIKIICL